MWKNANRRGAMACLWLAILTVPFTLTKAILADADIHFLPANLENSMVFAGAVSLYAWTLMATTINSYPPYLSVPLAAVVCVAITWIAAISPVAIALLVMLTMLLLVVLPMVLKRVPIKGLWDLSMLSSGSTGWYKNLWLWWSVFALLLTAIYVYFW
jgi:hypothetical protein